MNERRELDVGQTLARVRQRVPVAWSVTTALAAVVAGALVWLSVMSGAERYEASTVLLIDSPVELATATNSGVIDKLNRLRGKYAALAETEAIGGPAAETLDVRLGAVLGATEARLGRAELTLVVVGSGPDAETAQAFSRAMAESIVSFVENEHIENGIPLGDRFLFEIVREPTGARQVAPSAQRATTSALFAVALVAVAGLLVTRPWRSWTAVPGTGTSKPPTALPLDRSVDDPSTPDGSSRAAPRRRPLVARPRAVDKTGTRDT